MEQETQTPHKRRVRYKGKYPRKFEEKYKELNPEKYKDTIEHVISKGNTPAGMHISIMVNEILDFFEHSLFAPSKSAFTQQRYKLLPEGWDFLFHSFVTQCRSLSDDLYCGYRLLACDGSDVNIARNPSDERNFHP
mgnify:CR=1 FL=1